MNILYCLIIIFSIAITGCEPFKYNQSNTAIDYQNKGLYEYDHKNYYKAEKYFITASVLDSALIHSKYMIGYLNLYYLEIEDYKKARLYLKEVESNIPHDINATYLYNHIGITYLDEIAKMKEYDVLKDEELRLEARRYFNLALITLALTTKVLNHEDYAITFNNIGRLMIESQNMDTIKASIDYFDKAIVIKRNMDYIHNKAVALERLAHQVSSLVSAKYFNEALELYESNVGYKKSMNRARIIKNYYLKH